MNRPSSNILIKDPYLESASGTKTQGRSETNNMNKIRDRSHQTYNHHPHQTYNPYKKGIQEDINNNNLVFELQQTKNQFHRVSRAFTDENRLNQQILRYQAHNGEYHEALKLRNLDLNNKLVGIATDNKLLTQKIETDILKNYQDKDNIIRKYQAQAVEVLQLKKTINQLLNLKTRMQEQILQLRFVIDNQSERFNLEVREHIIRLQGMQRAMKNLGETKDQQLLQLRNRIRLYEDENRRLNDENRTLHFTNKDFENKKGISNLSHIHHLDSQTKQNIDHNAPSGTVGKQLLQQKHVNENLQKEINKLKRKLFDDKNTQEAEKNKSQQNKILKSHNSQNAQKQKIQNNGFSEFHGYVGSIVTLRNGINKEVFEVFFKSVRDGQKHRSNSLVIFIQNWKNLDIDRLQPYLDSYFEARDTLKSMYNLKKDKGELNSNSDLGLKIQQCIPLHISSRKGRNEINQWILSTIQFTKNQRQISKKSLNNLLLFLFRLLTIQYRITYPMQGKSYTIDADVKNQLHHEVAKAINYIRKYK